MNNVKYENVEQQTFDIKKAPEERKGLRGDYGNICLLIFLYTLQGLPFGIVFTIPLILATNKVEYDKQAIFTFAQYPYIFKFLWAPIVDSIYSRKFGRRKSWLIPSQYFIGGAMILTSTFVNELIGSENVPPRIYLLTLTMLIIVFLTATQDIAVDAWSLTMLAKRNVQYGSSSNTVGFVIGSFISTTLFLSLESAEFCNKFRSVPQNIGIITLQGFLFIVGIVFIVGTTLVWIFKKENETQEMEENIKVCDTFKILRKILKLRSVQLLASLLLTQQIGQAAIANASPLKFIEFGFKREEMSLLTGPIGFLQLFLPFIIVKTASNNPLTYFWRSHLLKLVVGCFTVALVFWSQTLHFSSSEYPTSFYVAFFVSSALNEIISSATITSLWTFLMKIADNAVGGTYISLMSMLSHAGNKWTSTLSIWLIDKATVTRTETQYICTYETYGNDTLAVTRFYNVDTVVVDGFYIESLICFVLGTIWLFVYKSLLVKMQKWPECKWRCIKKDITCLNV